jgi:hypothetical protein
MATCTLLRLALLIWGWSSDRTGERRWHLIAASVIAGIGFVAAGVAGNSFWSLAAMSLALVGMYGTRPTFLAASLDVPEWNGCCRRNRTDQFDRKPWRLCWTIHRGLDKGFDKQL